MGYLSELVIIIPVLLFSLSVHEFCHGYVAWKLGDPTAKRAGRLTLNPIAHLDLFGVLFAIFFKFGWAKPVPINPLYFRNPLRDLAISASAGPLSNLGLSIAFAIVYKLLGVVIQPIPQFITYFFLTSSFINSALFFFNLIPVPPLDGSRILFYLLPNMTLEKSIRYEIYGMFGILLLVTINLVIPIFNLIVAKPSYFLISILY